MAKIEFNPNVPFLGLNGVDVIRKFPQKNQVITVFERLLEHQATQFYLIYKEFKARGQYEEAWEYLIWYEYFMEKIHLIDTSESIELDCPHCDVYWEYELSEEDQMREIYQLFEEVLNLHLQNDCEVIY